ncbi:ABC transporter ATP-binding protein [Rhodococcus koreensis]
MTILVDENFLEVENLVVGYRGEPVLDQLSVSLREGEVVAVIGPNGAGKSTLLKCLAGIVGARSGAVRFRSRDLSRRTTEARVRDGLALVPEGRHLFKNLTVEDNLRTGHFAGRQGHSADDVYEMFPRLTERRQSLAGQLSGGEQQMLAIGRALIGGPSLLLVDEPSLGLAPLVTKSVFGVLNELASSGMSILLGEQNAYAAMEVADRCLVLGQGKIQFEGESRTAEGQKRITDEYQKMIDVADR